MTNEEAVDLMKFEETQTCLRECSAYRGDFSACEFCKHIEMMDMAINALEKQIPKKPKCAILPENAGKSYTCPSCVHQTEHYKAKTGIGKWQNYCHQCGQAMDWGE